MASRTSDDFENDWTFVDKDGKVDIQPRKNSVSYSKSLSHDEVLVSPSESPTKDGSEGEAEFEVLSGFQCHPPPVVENNQAAETARATSDLPHDLESETEDEFVAVQQSSCQCAADDGIMIISNHYCMDQDVSSVGDVTVEDPSPSELDNHNQESMQSSTNSSDSTTDGWRELPQLSESGSFSFGSDSNSSDEDNAIEPIPEEDENQDYVDLGLENEPLEEMGISTSSVFSFDSDLFNPSDADDDDDNEDDHSDITEVSEVIDEDKCRDQDEEEEEEVEDHLATEGSDGFSSFYVDIPTLFVVLGVTTALGFSIGYGLSVYVSNQALEMSGSIKRPGPKTASLPLNSDPMEPIDEVSRDFLDQLAMWKLEDRLDTHVEPETETEAENLFDTKALHEKLQLKHFKLMSLHESVKQRLRMSKVMSWYWRLKYEEEKSNKEGSEWSNALQEQLQETEKLYQQEKQIADLWRRMNENTKLRRAVAGGIKFDKYWKDFLHRWKKNGDRSASVNESQKVPVGTETSEGEESVGAIASKKPEIESQGRNREHIWDNIWADFRNRWTVDSHLKGDTDGSCQSKSGKCTFDQSERRDLTVLPGERSVTSYSPSIIERSLDRTVEKSIGDPNASVKNSKHGVTKKSQSFDGDDRGRDIENPPEEISNMKFTDLKGVPFNNPLFPNGIFSFGIPDYYLKRDYKGKVNPVAPSVASENRYLQVFSFADGTSDANWINDDGSVVKETLATETVKKTKKTDKSSRKVGFQRVKSYEAIVKRKCEEESVVKRKRERPSGHSKKQQVAIDGNRTLIQSQRHCLSKEKQQLKNLTQLRGQEIRKQRVQRRELKKKEREAKLRAKEAERVVSEMRRERRRLQMEKNNLRRSWKALKREKKKISSEKERHQKSRKEVKTFMATLNEEKQKLKRKKVKLKEKVKELLAKERKNLKLKEKALSAEKRKELERLRSKIAQEKNKLRQQKQELKSLKKAAKKEYKKWLNELRKVKRQEEERQAKMKEKARRKRENAERVKRHNTEFESVIREQAKYDKEKRRKKGEDTEHTVGRKRQEEGSRLVSEELTTESVYDEIKRQATGEKIWQAKEEERRQEKERWLINQELRKKWKNDLRRSQEVWKKFEKDKEERKRQPEELWLADEELRKKYEYEERKSHGSEKNIWEVKGEKGNETKRRAKSRRANEKQKNERENDERKRRHKRELDSVIREQAKYDKEKWKKKGEGEKNKVTKGEWKKADDNMKTKSSHQRDTDKNRKRSDEEESFRKQLEDVKKWLSDVHKKTLEQQQRQQTHWPWSLIKPTFHDDSDEEEETFESQHDAGGDIKEKELKWPESNSAKDKIKTDRRKPPGRCKWKSGRVEIKKIMSNTEKHGNENSKIEKERKKREMPIQSEMTLASEDRALTGFTNFTFDMDLVRMLLKGDDKLKRGDKTSGDSEKTTETPSFIIVSEQSTHRDVGRSSTVKRKRSRKTPERLDKGPKRSDKKPKWLDKKPKRPDDSRWWKENNLDTAQRSKKSAQSPIFSEDGRLTPDNLYEEVKLGKNVPYTLSPNGPIPPKDIGLSVEEWFEKRYHLPKNTPEKLISPQGPIFSDDVYHTRSSKGKKRKRKKNNDVQDKVCNSVDPETVESIPPPDWVFERAKGRTHQRSSPWYVRRAEDREFKRSTDEHDSQFPCGRKRQRYKGPLDSSWFFDRADDRAFQRLNNVPWYTRRAEGRETERQKGEDSWFLERGYYRNDLRDLTSWYGDQNWMPQGPSMEEHR